MKDHYHVVISTSNAEASGSGTLRVTDKNSFVLKREKIRRDCTIQLMVVWFKKKTINIQSRCQSTVRFW